MIARDQRTGFIINLALILLPLLILFMSGAKIYALAISVPAYSYVLFCNHDRKMMKSNYKNVLITLPTVVLIYLLLKLNSDATQIALFKAEEVLTVTVLSIVIVFVATITAIVAISRVRGDRTYDK